MKIFLKSRSLQCGTLAFFAVIARDTSAQMFTTLHNFTTAQSGVNNDGGSPLASLVLSGNTLFGAAQYFGSSQNGTVFKINTDSTGFTVLHAFAGVTAGDGSNPEGGLIVSGNRVYGTTSAGGVSLTQHGGTVFALNNDGTGYTILHSFSFAEGYFLQSTLVLSGNSLCGTTVDRSGSRAGTVFKVNTDGTGFIALHDFEPLNSGTNSDGSAPYGGLVLFGNTLYGTASAGGSSGNGTAFALNIDGTGFTTLHNFSTSYGIPATNSDGINPYTAPVLSSNTLYGTARYGGFSGGGTVFKVNTDGTGFSTLYIFTGGSDGGVPSGLSLSGNTLYGTTAFGGSFGSGTLFSINTDGTGFRTLYSFSAKSASSPYVNNDGANPLAGVLVSSNLVYGTTLYGGQAGNGTVFSFLIPPQLTIGQGNGNIVLAWPTSATGFTLQSTTNLASPVWATNLPAPVVVNGQSTVTTPISGVQQFFRLSQ